MTNSIMSITEFAVKFIGENLKPLNCKFLDKLYRILYDFIQYLINDKANVFEYTVQRKPTDEIILPVSK